MVHPAPTLDRDRLCEALASTLDHIAAARAEFEYRLVGTGDALLHGVELPAADIDLLVRARSDVDAIGAALEPSQCLFAPAWLPHSCQYYANYEVLGVEVGISTVEVESDADTVETYGRGPWVHYATLPCGAHTVPAVALELRLITELNRDRPDRYRPIIRHMRVHGCDIALVRRGIGGGRLLTALRHEVLRQLGVAPDASRVSNPTHQGD
jgi:hypothetical protein